MSIFLKYLELGRYIRRNNCLVFLSSSLKHPLHMLKTRNWSDVLVQAAFDGQLGFS